MNDRVNARLLWQLTRDYRLVFSMAIVSMAVGYLFMFGPPLAGKLAIDVVEQGVDGADIPPWIHRIAEMLAFGSAPGLMTYMAIAAIGTVLMTMLAGMLLYVRGRCSAIASEGIIRRLRDRIFSHLEHLASSYHDKQDTGDLLQRCSSDMETVRVFLAGQVIEISRAILMLLVVLPILFWLDTDMAWLSLASMPILLVSAVIFFRRVKELFLEVDESEARMTTVLQENLTGIRVVRAFARQEFEIGKFGERNREFRDLNQKLIGLLGLYYGGSDLICLGQICLLLIVGATWTIEGHITVGTLFAFLTYESMIIWPIRHMGRVLTDSGKAIVSMGRIAEVLAEPMETQNETDPGKRLSGRVEFHHVGFGFDAHRPVLSDVSFTIGAGQTLAILGPPGAGKSTIAQLLMRLYDYTSGSILLDGHELSTLSRKFVRSQISIVLQEPFLYSASILGNLLVGRVDASFQEVVEATQEACIHESIERFPRGYDSLVGERGVTLSGGQRQRIALARALLKRPPILILDDALSAVDTDTESQILAALAKARNKQTTIIVAHRLSTVMHADKILVLNEGRIVQEGTHESLSQVDGIYRNLCEIQGAIQDQIESDLVRN
ncbi:MAG: ABC transporter ATP-binding protein [Pseudomonadales bacterium]|nr:ABC transporter ATP-binding protein [Pseudomonadales bacterium]